jgi:hypothetical protein
MSELVKMARDLAHRAHEGQVDKAGCPYIEHVARVAAAVSDDPEAEAVAWLHDVLEDAPAFNADVCRFPEPVYWSAYLLSRFTATNEAGYYERLRRNPLAMRVKLADIADNSDEARLALLPADVAVRLRKKYARALSYLSLEGER